jgi:hypothetical protein
VSGRKTSEPLTDAEAEAEAAAAATRVKRQLLMGSALVLALLSLVSGVVEAGRAVELGLAALAGGCVLLALRIKPTGGSYAVRETPAAGETPRRDG